MKFTRYLRVMRERVSLKNYVRLSARVSCLAKINKTAGFWLLFKI